ncbi:helix-turn-helix domain-containing protein [Leptolyngbya ohadii]|uniref:helix-turn-helix domain-containing protein n=1 Tax=Leptolyngbya ohadii TaxID=1962290 RepID=UPI000B59EF92|nr:helix-turn-helix transcriptional regulator [Leptolyngbya ohadii]
MILKQKIALNYDRDIAPDCDRWVLSVISLAIDGRVQFITPQAEHLLNQYFGCQAAYTLPDLLEQWFHDQTLQLTQSNYVLPTCFLVEGEQSEQRLFIRLIPNPIEDQYLLLLEEQAPRCFSIAALESLGLTRREAEVLFWVAKDKSNIGIARVLDCCEGTVRKHLERLYKKLNVQTRIGAVMTALEKLGLLQA